MHVCVHRLIQPSIVCTGVGCFSVFSTDSPCRVTFDNLIEFNQELLLDLRAEAADTDLPITDLAFERLCSTLEAEGEIETSDRTEYRGSSSGKSLRIDGHGGDPRETDGVLSVIAC